MVIGLSIGVGCLVVIVAAIIIIVVVRKQQMIKQSNQEADDRVSLVASTISKCFGENNIEDITQNNSRVTIIVKDISKVNKEEIQKELDSVMYMGNKIVFVVGSKSEEFYKSLKENLSK